MRFVLLSISATEQLSGELHKSEVFLIPSTLFLAKAENITSVVMPVHTFMTRSRVSKSRLKTEFYFHRYVHFACVHIYFFRLHHKQCTSD